MLRVQAVASRLAAQTRALVTVRRFGAAADHGAHGHGHGPKEIDFSDPEALTKRFSELTNNIGKPRHHVQHQEVYDPSKHYNTSGYVFITRYCVVAWMVGGS